MTNPNVVEILHRETRKVLFRGNEGETLRQLVERLCGERRMLNGAHLQGADLHGLNLRHGHFAFVNFSGANLRETDLTKADLSNANLMHADLSSSTLAQAKMNSVDLTGANLYDAKLNGANLEDSIATHAKFTSASFQGARCENMFAPFADFTHCDFFSADLCSANLKESIMHGADFASALILGANLTDVNLSGALLPESMHKTVIAQGAILSCDDPEDERELMKSEFRERHPEVPVIDDLDLKIYQAINAGGELDMGGWHSRGRCGSSHCRAGWAIHLAGELGYGLEDELGPIRAGGYIYIASTGRWPNFFSSNDLAWADIKRSADVV